jgi:NADH:ubiquinone oxidoreductase subunit 6 (subunit J)
MVSLLLLLVAVVFAVQAIRARGLITSALWLAGVSALLAMVLYQFGARQVAVIELSVGTGLVTVLFVLAINIAGDKQVDGRSVVPKGLAVGFGLLFALVLGGMLLSGQGAGTPSLKSATIFDEVFWRERGLDGLVQVVMIFSGVLGFLGLLSEAKAPLDGTLAEAVSSRRNSELKAMEERIRDQQEDWQ